MERVEIDHSPLKTVVGTAAGPIGQPWITVLIDYYSRMITGFCVGFEPPSYAVIMEALRQAILPKTGLRARPPAIVGEWPCYGVPEKIVCDRGSDFTSRDLEQAAFQLGIELDFMPPRMPHLKGTVESFFDTLNDQLVSALPGRTFRSWQERADHNADLGPFLPYEALVEIIQIHLTDVYAVSKHPTTAQTRLEMWQESAAEFPPCLPASPDELVVLLAKRVDRMLSVRGIELGGMFYQCDELMALRAELAVNNLPCDRLQVRYNPWDLGEAWVLNPLTRQHIRVPAVDTALQGMTEYQWRVLKRAIRERFDEPEHVLSLAAARNSIRDLAEAAMTTPSPKRRVRAARLLQPPLSSAPSESTESSEPLDSSYELSRDAMVAPADSDMSRLGALPQGQELPSTPQRPDDRNLPESDPFDLDVEDWGVAC